MRIRRGLALGAVAGALTLTAAAAAHQLAQARQAPVVVMRFLLGYYDRHGRFVPVAGRGATNVDRNALAMFVFSGRIDTGPTVHATLPLTLEEQAELQAALARDPDVDPRTLGFEPGVVPRKRSEFRDAQLVATGSVSADSVVITSSSGGGNSVARGTFFKVTGKRGRRKVVPNRVLFNPRFVAATFNRPGEIDYNPEGLDASTQYSVFLDGGPGVDVFRSVKNRDGQPLAAEFSTTFTTSDRYVQDFSRPQIRDSYPTFTGRTVNVPSDADVELSFSEPMDISTFRPPRFQGDDAATLVVRYSQSPQNGLLAGRNVLGSVRVKPQTAGNVIQFRPLQGFGQGPYEIEVTVTAGVTDLSGNNIIRQLSFLFETVLDPSADAFGEHVETFDNTAQMDPAFTPTGDNLLAEWDSAARPGHLRTTVQAATYDVLGPSPTSQTNVWNTQAVRWQMLYPSSNMGNRARTLTGFSWYIPAAPAPGSTQLNLTYPSTSVQIGHANDLIAASGFPGGPTSGPGPQAAYYRNAPVLVTVPTNYAIPVADAQRRVTGPAWSKDFNYDGQHAVILELQHSGNGSTAANPDEWWEIDSGFAQNGLTFSLFQANPVVNGARTFFHSIRWNYLTPGAEARSTWYDTGRDSPRYVPQQLVPFQQPQGTSVAFRFQGAKAEANNPNQIDSSSITTWTTDLRTLANYRFFRFEATLVNNTASRVAPEIDTLTVPYTYRP